MYGQGTHLLVFVQEDSGNLGAKTPDIIISVHQVIHTGVGSWPAGIDLKQGRLERQEIKSVLFFKFLIL